jgi:hypothetical protein
MCFVEPMEGTSLQCAPTPGLPAQSVIRRGAKEMAELHAPGVIGFGLSTLEGEKLLLTFLVADGKGGGTKVHFQIAAQSADELASDLKDGASAARMGQAWTAARN